MLARVNLDPFELDAINRLQDDLSQSGIRLILDHTYCMKDTPILNFINPHIRISDMDRVCETHKTVKSKTLFSSGNIPVSCMDNTNNDSYVNNVYCYYAKPPVEDIPILMVVHARSMYLELTLNSLAYSLTYDPKIPVHILMSMPTQETRNVVEKFKSKLNLSVYETETNVFAAGFNLLIQHIRPEKFIILEEDFILPQNLKHIMPYWVRIFNERLNYFELVGFSTSVENSSSNHFSVNTKAAQKTTFIYNWENSPHGQGMPVTGNTLCTTTKHYLKCSERNGPYYVTADGILITKSRWSICSITGYHIGFNQEMDYGISLSSNRFPDTAEKQTLIDYQSNKKIDYSLKEVYNLA